MQDTYLIGKNELLYNNCNCLYLENMNIDKKNNIESNPIMIYDSIYPNYVEMHDDEIYIKSVYDTYYYIFGDMIKNTISFGCRYYDKIEGEYMNKLGLMNYSSPINLKNSQIRLSICNLNMNTYTLKEYYWNIEPYHLTNNPEWLENEFLSKIYM